MSFLTITKPSVPESPSSYFGSRHDLKARPTTEPAQTKEDIMGSLQVFRDDLRKQISHKLTRNPKSIDASTPAGPTDFRAFSSTKNTATPSQKGTFRDQDAFWSSIKGSQNRSDIKKDFGRHGEVSSPLKQNFNTKNSDIMGVFSKNKDSMRSSAVTKESSLFGSKSPLKKNESPKREGRSTLDILPLSHFKREGGIYLETKGNSPKAVRQQGFREDIKQILQSGRIAKSDADRPYGDRPRSGLTQQVSSLNSKKTEQPYSSLLQAYESAPVSKTSTLLKNTRISEKDTYRNGYRNDWEEPTIAKYRLGAGLKTMETASTGRDSEQERDSYPVFKLQTGNRERSSLQKEALISDQLTVQKLYDLQDLFFNATDKGFDQLSSEYVEELIKLSSVIMHRVKNSSYYNKM